MNDGTPFDFDATRKNAIILIKEAKKRFPQIPEKKWHLDIYMDADGGNCIRLVHSHGRPVEYRHEFMMMNGKMIYRRQLDRPKQYFTLEEVQL